MIPLKFFANKGLFFVFGSLRALACTSVYVTSTLSLREVGVIKIKGYVRFLYKNTPGYGELQGNEIHELFAPT